MIYIIGFLILLMTIRVWVYCKKSKQYVFKPEKDIFNQRLFNFFANEHNLTLLQGEINDIKNEVYIGILDDLPSFSENALDDLFHGTIEEMNRRKAERGENK